MKAPVKWVVFLLAASWVVACGGFAKGDFSYNFASPPPASFQTGVIGPPSATFSASFANGMLRLSDSRTPAQGGIGGSPGFGAFGLEQSQVFRDVRISAVLNPAGNSDDLLNITRGHGGVGVYSAGIDFSSGRLTLGPVAMFNSDDPNQGSQPRLTNLNRSYFLTFDVIGNEINARVYDQSGGNQLLHGHFTDNNLGGPALQPSIAGVSVIWLGTNATNLDGSYDNLSAMAIPEPNSAIWLTFCLVVGIVRFRRSKC
jgi:hypothetical protein